MFVIFREDASTETETIGVAVSEIGVHLEAPVMAHQRIPAVISMGEVRKISLWIPWCRLGTLLLTFAVLLC